MMDHSADNIGSERSVSRRRDSSPERRPTGCWSGIWRIWKRKRVKRVVPASDLQESTGGPTDGWTSNPESASENSSQLSTSLSLMAPPSSPASFANSRMPSSVQSPSSFTVSSSVVLDHTSSSRGICWDRTPTMFTIGPYAHETAIVTPPALSAFTTAPSTAPFTPPPELAHLTRPPSPDVQFAKLLASSLCSKGAIENRGTTSAPSQCSSLGHILDDHSSLMSSDSILDLLLPASGGFGSESCSPIVGSVSSRLPDLYFHDSGCSDTLQQSNHSDRIMHRELGFEGEHQTMTEENGDTCPKDGQDCDKSFLGTSGFADKFSETAKASFVRNSRDLTERCEMQKDLREGFSISSNIDSTSGSSSVLTRSLSVDGFCSYSLSREPWWA